MFAKGDATRGRRVNIRQRPQAIGPAHAPAPAGAFGTALIGSKDWAGDQNDIATGGKGYVHLYLVGAADLKPVKAISLVAIAG